MIINPSLNNNHSHMVKINLVHKALWISKNRVFLKIKEIGMKMVLKKGKGKVLDK